MKELIFEQFLPISLREAWAFFASPLNLNLITPEKLKFRMISQLPEKMEKGLIIRYTIRPMINLPVNWVTKISAFEEEIMFADTQIKGPYKTWIHEHHFTAVENGVMMKDILKYDVGYGLLGKLASILWVDKQVREIFTYRKQKLEHLFALK